MADLTADPCCAPEQQATCCEPSASAKADCCGHEEVCGCDADAVGRKAGALTRRAFKQAIANASLADVEIRETDRVHAKAASAVVRAHKATAG